jgi:hypothetical protein
VLCVPTGGGTDGSAESLKRFWGTWVGQREWVSFNEEVSCRDLA